jgi:hypothetical protein
MYGAYRGGNSIFMSYVVIKLYPSMKVFACDSSTKTTVGAGNITGMGTRRAARGGFHNESCRAQV